jgi:hypothetical protein
MLDPDSPSAGENDPFFVLALLEFFRKDEA